jgi:ribose 5-phosphate isomerase RpiB
MKLRVALGADHEGFALKNELLIRLHQMCEAFDLGGGR